jgi:multidrug efflux pump subunit AcrA (membrane-fusion protein)
MPLGSAVIATAESRPIQAVILPWGALWSDGGKPAVWIVNPADQSVSLTPVEVSAYTTDSVVLSRGLSAGDVVVVEGAKLLHPGQIVTVEAAP